MLRLHSCLRCKSGDVYRERDMYGSYLQCIQCGHIVELSAMGLPVEPPSVDQFPENQPMALPISRRGRRRQSQAMTATGG